MKLETRIARLRPGELLVVPYGELRRFDFATGRTPIQRRKADAVNEWAESDPARPQEGGPAKAAGNTSRRNQAE
jgi:hypothetical protein